MIVIAFEFWNNILSFGKCMPFFRFTNYNVKFFNLGLILY